MERVADVLDKTKDEEFIRVAERSRYVRVQLTIQNLLIAAAIGTLIWHADQMYARMDRWDPITELAGELLKRDQSKPFSDPMIVTLLKQGNAIGPRLDGIEAAITTQGETLQRIEELLQAQRGRRP